MRPARARLPRARRASGLETDRLDLYLLHWRGTFRWPKPCAFEQLVREGKIRHWGVSNFDVKDMEESLRLVALTPAGRVQPGALQRDAARRRAGPASLVRTTPSGHGLFAPRAGAARRPSRLFNPSPSGSARRPPRWRSPGCFGRNRGDRHPQVGPRERASRGRTETPSPSGSPQTT